MMKPKEEKILGTEEALGKLITELMKLQKEKYKILTDLDDKEVCTLSLLSTIAESLKIKELRTFVANFCNFRVSRDRMGRRELVGIASLTGIGISERKGKISLKSLIPGI